MDEVKLRRTLRKWREIHFNNTQQCLRMHKALNSYYKRHFVEYLKQNLTDFYA